MKITPPLRILAILPVFILASVISNAQKNRLISEFSGQFGITRTEVRYSEYLKSSHNEIQAVFSGLFLLYKHFISSQDVNSCNSEPSCSVYMMESIKKRGLFPGILDGLDRLTRCHSYIEPGKYSIHKETKKYDDPVD
jgi:putative component of membrane protein insertase Oxa1/YidC/SpoIIIJ protein YidD